MLPLQLFKSPTFSGANLLTLFLYAGLSVGFFFLALNLVQVQGYTKTQAGLAILPFSLLLTVLSRYAGRFMDRNGPRLPLIVGPALAGLGFFWMAFCRTDARPGRLLDGFLARGDPVRRRDGLHGGALEHLGDGVGRDPLCGRGLGHQQRRLAHGGRAGDRHRRRDRADHLLRRAGEPYRQPGADRLRCTRR